MIALWKRRLRMLIFIKSPIFTLAATILLFVVILDLIGPNGFNQFWATATLKVNHDQGCLKGTPTQSAAHSQSAARFSTMLYRGTASFHDTVNSQGTAEIQRTADFQGKFRRLKSKRFLKLNKYSSSKAKLKKLPNSSSQCQISMLFGTQIKGKILSEEHKYKYEDLAHPFFDDTADQDAAVTSDLERKSDETEEVNIEEKEASNVKSGDTEELDFGDNSSTDPKDKGKGILVEEPKKKKLTLQQIRALETTNDEEVARKIQAEWDAEEERKRFEELKKTKPKTTLRKPTSLAQERNQMMSFLKGQGYKNLQKLKYPQMKELYDKVQASIKDSFKDFIPMDSEKERETLKEREAKRLLRKRKATISEEQPSKKPKLRTETIDELRNYLRVVDFEKNAQDKESLEGISMITELQVIDSPPDGERYPQSREFDDKDAGTWEWKLKTKVNAITVDTSVQYVDNCNGDNP
ncbi:hypothetical protein Tco_0553772 [Tanacetum coccineum]